MKKRMLKVSLAVMLFIAIFAVTAHAENSYEVEFSGKSSTPIFTINGVNVFCKEPDATHPETGVKYTATKVSAPEFDELSVNDYLYTGEKNDLYWKVYQQVMWVKVKPATNYRVMTQVLLGDEALSIFDALNAAVNTDDYIIDYTLYTSAEKDELGNPYQQLIGASVKKREIIVSPDPDPDPDPEPETTTEEPTTEEPPTEPETEEPTVEPTTEEPSTEPETEEPTVELTTEPETQPEPTELETIPVLPGEGPIQAAPKTGDKTSVAFLVTLMVMSAAALVITSKKKKSIILEKD